MHLEIAFKFNSLAPKDRHLDRPLCRNIYRRCICLDSKYNHLSIFDP